jgi:Ca2+-binding RTX toxin-like protein
MRRYLFLIGLGVVFMCTTSTASNSVDPSGASASLVPVSVDAKRPPECAGLPMQSLVVGTGVFAGSAGADLMLASASDDQVSGGSGDDCLVGGGGNDTLDGGPGYDVCVGGPGVNTYVGCEVQA